MPPTAPAPKGILKKPKNATPAAPPSSEPLTATTPLPLEQQIAIQQAKLLMQQRNQEIKPPVPVETYERLTELPRVREPTVGAGNPAPEDVQEFLETVHDFLPREYLELVEERNCLGNCGYALCPRPRRSYVGEFKIRPSGIAKVADLNMWCSDACAARALFVKVQLENPSYVREDGKMVVRLELREETHGSSSKGSSRKTDLSEVEAALDQLEIERKQQSKTDAAVLAVERGDASRPARKVDVTIREKTPTEAAQAPEPQEADTELHLILEGHKTTFGTGKNEDEDEASDDDYLPSAIRM